MNRKLISQALGRLDGALIEECLTYPENKRCLVPERKQTMGKFETTKKHSRKFVAVILAACLVFALATTAYAANFWGIRTLFDTVNEKLPQEADPYIQHHETERIQSEEKDWTAEITESLADGSKIMLTIHFSGGDKYLLAPADMDPSVGCDYMGVDNGLTLEEYAKQTNRELLFVGGSLMPEEALGVFTETMRPQSTSPGELDILLISDRMSSDPVEQVSCHITAKTADAVNVEDVQRLELPFSLKPVTDGETNIYVPEKPDAIAGMTLGNAKLTKSATGWSVEMVETITDETAYGEIMITEIEGLGRLNGGGVMLDETHVQFQSSMNQGEVGDPMIMRFYDWDKNLIGEVTFHRQ